MTGCRHNAKNTLVKNYLYLAEQNGATVLPLTTVTRRRAAREEHGGGYDVHVRFTKARTGRASGDPGADRRAGRVRRLRAGHPAAAAPDARRGPPAAALAPAWATCPAPTPSRSSAPSPRTRRSTTARASRSPRASTPTPTPTSSRCRYGKGSNSCRCMQTVLTDGDGPAPRWRTWLREMWRERAQRRRAVRRQALVGADRHRAGDAEPRQLDHHLHQADPRHAAPLPDLEAGPRRARTRPGSRPATRRSG